MILYTILIAVGLILIMAVAAIIGRSQQKTAPTRFSRRFGLDVPEGMESSIRAGVQARHIGSLVGTVISVTIAAVVLLLVPGFQLLATWWCLFASYLMGAGIGAAVAILLAEHRRERGVVRVARTSAVTVDDYVSPFQNGFARVSVVIAVFAFGGDCWLAADDSAHYLSIVSGVLAAASIVLFVVYEVVAPRFVSRGTMAGTDLELAWDDALRSYALTNLNGMVALLGLYSFIAYDTLLVSNPSGRILSQTIFTVYTGLFPIGATIGIVTVVVFMTRIRSRQHFLRRLWPTLAVRVDDNVSGAYTEIMGGR